MFALIALGMCFVIMTGGIDLSVGSTAALASVVAALSQPLRHPAPALLAGTGAGLVRRPAQRPDHHPAAHPAVHRHAGDHAGRQRHRRCSLAGNQSVSVSYDSGFTDVGQGDLLGFPVPAWIAALAYVSGSVALNYTRFGRHVLAVGGGEEAARLMGLPVDRVTAPRSTC